MWSGAPSNQPTQTFDRHRSRLLLRPGIVVAVIGLVGLGVGLGTGLHAGGRHVGGTLPSTSVPTTSIATGPSIRQGLVQVAPGVSGQPHVAEVTAVLTQYFTAINRRDYARWLAALVPNSDRNRRRFAGYRTTHDSEIRLLDVQLEQNGQIEASVGFISHQAPPDGNGHRCWRWSIAYSLVPYRGSLRIDLVQSAQINMQRC